MRVGGSKEKGSQFERNICKSLSLLISNGTRTDLLWRSAMSGGRATLQLRQDILNKTQAGDISSIDILGHWLIRDYIIDCKHYENLEYISGFLSNTGRIYRFWQTLAYDAIRRDKRPLMIAKQNNRPTIMITLPGKNPTSEPPLITLHKWPAEIRLYGKLQELMERHENE